MELALTDLFRARWSDAIHAEWIRNVRENNPNIPEDKLIKTRDLMNAHVRDALVTGYEPLIPSLSLPDQNDRHVLAAAISPATSSLKSWSRPHKSKEIGTIPLLSSALVIAQKIRWRIWLTVIAQIITK
jgi:hypothetical protein